MVSTSAKLAVKRRALRAATWLDLCAGHLLGELEKQTVELYQRHGVLPGGSTDQDLIPITFERCDVEELIRGMREKWRHRLHSDLSLPGEMSAIVSLASVPPIPQGLSVQRLGL